MCCVGVPGVDEKLVGEAWMIHVVDGRGEDGGHHLQRGEHALNTTRISLTALGRRLDWYLLAA